MGAINIMLFVKWMVRKRQWGGARAKVEIRKATALGGNRTIIETEGTKFNSLAFGRIPLIPTKTWFTGLEAGCMALYGSGRACECNLPSQRLKGASPPALVLTYANIPLRCGTRIIHRNIRPAIDGRASSGLIPSICARFICVHLLLLLTAMQMCVFFIQIHTYVC